MYQSEHVCHFGIFSRIILLIDFLYFFKERTEIFLLTFNLNMTKKTWTLCQNHGLCLTLVDSQSMTAASVSLVNILTITSKQGSILLALHLATLDPQPKEIFWVKFCSSFSRDSQNLLVILVLYTEVFNILKMERNL